MNGHRITHLIFTFLLDSKLAKLSAVVSFESLIQRLYFIDLMSTGATSGSASHDLTVFEVNLAPLSDRMYSGSPLLQNNSVRA